ncbi:MAG: GTPase Era [Bacteroidales bacterium]|nr:GTPase Era [Bacteroidales bacterium]
MRHKSGFVNIIGNPNTGKSTLMNALVGEKLSVVTSKAQTTRHRILGIVNGPDFQIVFSDTPGIVKPAYKLHHAMMKSVRTAFTDADVMLYLSDVTEKADRHMPFIDKIKGSKIPVIIAINKSDLSEPEKLELIRHQWTEMVPGATVIPISALYHYNLDRLFKAVLDFLPSGPPFYPDGDLTDRPERFFVAEIIREKIFMNYEREVPYSCEVLVEEFKEAPEIVRIEAVIHVIRESQKSIVIGHKGEALKKVGMEARKDIEEFLGKKVFLGLKVKVSPDWRNNERYLKTFGYSGK